MIKASLKFQRGILRLQITNIITNIRTILMESQVDPRSLETHALKDWRVYPQCDAWTVPLLRNLLEIRANNWEVVFNDETEKVATDEDVSFMVAAICTW